jgi:hypothetical protein
VHEEDDDLEWERHKFPEGDEPTVLTTTSGFCEKGKRAECPGWSEDHRGQPVFCVCPCH